MPVSPPPLDLVFPVCGTTLAAQHGYPLYAALSRLLPWVHEANTEFALAPITGHREALDQFDEKNALRHH